MKFEKEFNELRKLNLRPEDFIVVGSGPMMMRGIRDSKDLDIVVTQTVWERLSTSEQVEINEFEIPFIQKPNVEILNPAHSIFTNSSVIPVEEIYSRADSIEGFQFVNLEHLKKIKKVLGREKDLEDIKLIDNYLSKKDS